MRLLQEPKLRVFKKKVSKRFLGLFLRQTVGVCAFRVFVKSTLILYERILSCIRHAVSESSRDRILWIKPIWPSRTSPPPLPSLCLHACWFFRSSPAFTSRSRVNVNLHVILCACLLYSLAVLVSRYVRDPDSCRLSSCHVGYYYYIRVKQLHSYNFLHVQS